ncbi:MAG: SGNH/GDSL hydrolase family protein [Thalassotalea sp.]|nr:SGNH/GDSL hydrolase family protein [Thalassotalea sp.]
MQSSSIKNFSFYIILIALPFAFFLILEAGLRFIDYGKDHPLFIENPASPEYLLPKPDAIKRYFPEGADVPSVSIETNFFLKEKPKNGIRIFVQGGSTAAGYPFGYGASIAGMLDYRLKQTFPDRTVEVINTALSAVNSYTVLDFVDEIIEQQPDAVLIYAGHNEYLGILGVGSAYTAANSQTATLLYLKAKSLRIFQLLQNIYWSFSVQESPIDKQTSRTFMSKVAKHKNIPFNSALYHQGLEQFETNMSMIIDKYKSAGIPVFISTIASNLADQKPFSSSKLPTDITKKYAGETRIITNELLNDAQKYQSADLFYQAGKILVNENKHQNASDAFEQARDLDLLRFRAPKPINKQIKYLAKSKSVHLVDSEMALKAAAPNNIIDNSLMLEHLHPTINGYFIIADTFYHAIEESKLLGEFPNKISTQTAQQDMPIFESEIFWGKAKIAGLMADYPFTDKPTKVMLPTIVTWHDKLGLAAYTKQASWLTIAIENINQSKEKNKPQYIKSVKLLADAMPYSHEHNHRAGIVLLENREPQQALRYLIRAVNNNAKDTNSQLALSHTYLKLERFQQAIHLLESVLLLDPKNTTANDVLPKIRAHLSK